jgi:hypothetical protein
MTVTAIKRVEMPNLLCPGVVVIETNSPVEDVVATGWLGTQKSSIQAINNGAFQFKVNDMLAIYSQPEDGAGFTFNWYQIFPDFLSVNPIGAIFPVDENIVAHAGGGQANATKLKLGYNVVTTVATTGDSVILPDDVKGQLVVVMNTGSNAVNIYPAIGDKIDTIAINSPFNLAANNSVIFFGMKTLQWFTISN